MVLVQDEDDEKHDQNEDKRPSPDEDAVSDQ